MNLTHITICNLNEPLCRNKIKLDDLKLTIWKHKEKTIRDWKQPKPTAGKQVEIAKPKTTNKTQDNPNKNINQETIQSITLMKSNSNSKLSKEEINQFNNELQQQQAKIRLYHLGRYRYVAHGTTTNKKEEEVTENIKNSIDKQRKGIEKELKERLNKVNMELKDITNSISVLF